MTDFQGPLTSIGIDVGTTTSHAIVSRLQIETPPGDAASPAIVDREIVHRGEVRETPLVDSQTIDVDRVAAFVDRELTAAGVSPAEIDTGAVIVTGETARRENAEPLVHRLAADTGQFVAATAGAALEAVLAGRGSGAAARAAETGGTVANVDVGGGTTNIAIFDGSQTCDDGMGFDDVTVAETRCLDVGGRLVTVDDDGHVESVSPPARTIADALDLPVAVGSALDADVRDRLMSAMVDAIVDSCSGPPFDALTRSLSIGTLPDDQPALSGVVFSGGVGRLVRTPPKDPFEYGDLGGGLAAAIADHETVRSWSVFEPAEDIRATVVGAGTETTTLSGRTISLDESVLPLRNVPVAAVSGPVSDTEETFKQRFDAATAAILSHHDPGEVDAIALSIDDVGDLTYDRIRVIADALESALAPIPPTLPVVVVTRQNCAKVLGQTLRRTTDRSLLVLDELAVDGGDYLDVGEPTAGGESVPAVVKTLAFGE
ncbi:reactivating factor for ethanolamine ammonia lyase [Natrialba chahannaoensis JCM 10990]|uniref:Reactivating factor for ethanolamine ammonia lyase n=1 Tax=Natrialba chahannaoensis JCM 10990 TaxID=1227492 RepID=M0B7A1_9EURY|nr:ethanolamine ammonia-lyase reactivating factor EutA [Natrialba chahannaoensis]ELZ06392.1 reactivating factor for ethanolamine ammonia lyase [Natrialba chahannaoensis JCM 10990]